MNYSNKAVFVISILLYLLLVLRNTWLPGMSVFMDKEPVMINLFAFCLFLMVFEFKVIISKDTIRGFEGLLFKILFFLLLVSIFFFNPQEITKFKYLLRLISFFAVIFIYFYLLPKYVIDNNKDFLRLLNFASVFSLLVALVGFILYFQGFSLSLKLEGSLTSIILHPNYLPPILLMGIYSGLYLFEVKKAETTKFKSNLLLASILVQLIALLLTLSRNGIIALMMGFVIYFVYKYKYKIVLLVPFFLFMFILVKSIFLSKGFASFISRFFLLIPAYFMMTESFVRLLWGGYGFTNTFEVYKNYMIVYNPIDIASFEQTINNPHNSFLSIILMFGLLFFIFLMILIIVIIYKFQRKFILNNNNMKSKVGYIILLSLNVSLITMGLFEGQLVQVEYFNLQPYLFTLGIMYYLTKYNKSLFPDLISLNKS